MEFQITLDEVEERWEKGWRRYRLQRWSVIWLALTAAVAGLLFIFVG